MKKSRPPVQPTPQRDTLPTALTRFIGREREIGEIKQLLSERRLLTLTGPGGCGKTRLAIQVASEMMDSFKDGLWWVELAALADESLVPQTVANALGLREVPDQTLSETLAHFLHPKHLLLVIDNCEHLIRACAQLADLLLRTGPDLSILATSREALGIAGETAWTVPSLSLPDGRQPRPSFADLAQYEAVQLFVDRAVAVQPSFKLTELNASAVAQVCQQLDGIPLAIELAAARVKVLQTAELAARLDNRFHLLTAGSRTALPRHQTLRAAIDWSYDLLTEPERVLLRRLAVFAGGCTLEAVEQVCADEGGREGIVSSQILDLLSHLVDKSLVIVDNQSGETRYHMLETLRQYGHEKLLESGEIERVRARHLAFFLKLAEEAEPKLEGANQIIWLNKLEKEHDNIRTALEYSLEGGEAESGLRLAGALNWYWYIHSHWSEGRQWLRELVANGKNASVLARAKALFSAGFLAIFQNDYHGVELCEQSLILYRELGDKRGMSWAIFMQGLAAVAQGDHARCIELTKESLSLRKEIGDKRGVAYSLNLLGEATKYQAEYNVAKQYLEAGLQLFREVGDQWGIGLVLNNLGDLASLEHDDQLAAELIEEGLALWRELGDKRMTGICFFVLGVIESHQGNRTMARDRLLEALSLLHQVGDKLYMALSLEVFASVEHARDNPERAARLLGAAGNLRQATGIPVASWARADYDQSIAAVRAELDETTFAQAWAEGRAMTLEQAIEYALETPAQREQAAHPPTPRQAAKQQFGGLTERERQVAVRIAHGESNREIAEGLVLSERTVESHVTNILNKLGFTSRAQVRKWATEKALAKRDT